MLNAFYGYLPAVVEVPVGVLFEFLKLIHLVEHLMHSVLGREELQTAVSISFRGAQCNERNQEVHVIDEGVVVNVGQIMGLVLVSSLLVVVNVDNAVLHAGNVAQVRREFRGIEGVFPALGRWVED